MDQYPKNTTSETGTGLNNSLLDDAYMKYLPMSNPGMVAIMRMPDMRLFFVNEQFEYYLGYSNSDLSKGKGIFFDSLLEEYQRDHLIHQLNYTEYNIAARSRFVIYRLKAKNNSQLPFYIYTAPFSAPDNKHGKLFFLLLHPDLSRFGLPFTSFESKELFLQQFKTESFGNFEWIKGVENVFCSEGIYRIYEIAPEQYKIKTLFATEFVHPNDKARVQEATTHALNTGEDLDIEYTITTAGKKQKLIHCLARSLKNEVGRIIKFTGSIRDITEQRAIEETLKNKLEELNHSNKELEEFAYIASHDMQEPLRKITTFSDRLAEKYKDVLTGDGAMYLSRMIASAENMRQLINNLLDFSRISKTQQPFEPTNLNVIIREVKTDLELVIEETKTTIETAALPIVDAIQSQMKQLFTNIIGNAIKFRKPDVRPYIAIDTCLISEKEKLQHNLTYDTAYYKIQITDNGIGIEDEYTARIFQVFQRLHGKSEYPGSGIGLAICKKILEYHHGVIYAENIAGKGSRFTFILPQHQLKHKEDNL